jgi:hypothetical protein
MTHLIRLFSSSTSTIRCDDSAPASRIDMSSGRRGRSHVRCRFRHHARGDDGGARLERVLTVLGRPMIVAVAGLPTGAALSVESTAAPPATRLDDVTL